MKTFEVWSEGYLASGMDGIPARASLLGEVEAETFQEACDKLCSPESFQSTNGSYNPTALSVWGCRLFDNAPDARKSFG